jgi:sulfite reductase (ferredoxin)
MYKIPSTLDGDIDYNESLIQKFRNGDITAAQLKSNRVPMGIYEQRKDNHYMLRIRCTGGVITPDQLKEVARVGRKVGCSHIHLTTRQELQIHNVDLTDATPALKALQKKGLSTQGGGGNTIRNIMVNPLGGLTDGEAFNPYPYAMELTTRLIAEKDSFTMPRKLKIAFDYNEQDADYSLINDFGLQATRRGDELGFVGYLGGSCASHPHRGWKVFDFLPVVDLFRALKAAKNFFNKYGNRKNRHKARIRYIFYKYGEEETIRLYMEEFNALKGDASLDLVVPTTGEAQAPQLPFAALKNDSEAFLQWKSRYAHAQKQPGLYYVTIPFLHGNTYPDTLEAIADYLKAYGDDVIRFTQTESMQLRNLPEAYLANIYDFFTHQGFRLNEPVMISQMTCCTGADTCRLGICLPKGAIKGIRYQLLNSGLNLDAIPYFRIKMNGCTNTCAQNTWSDLGFSGRIGRAGDHPYPAYTVWLPSEGRQQLSSSIGYIPAKKIAAFIQEYLEDVIAQQPNFADYYEYVVKRGKEVAAKLIEKFQQVAPYEQEPDLFFDWDSDEKFTLTKSSQAECSAGLFDIIELDKDTIAEKRKQLEEPGVDVEKTLQDMVFSEARMLLVTRGLDPRTDDEVYNGFIQLFIDADIVPASYKPLIEARRSGTALTPYKKEVLQLADLMNLLYENMDDSLQFKVTPEIEAAVAAAKQAEAPKVEEAPAAEEAPKAEAAADDIARKKDLRGVACPMNFVKTKIELASMQSGQLLEILLDDGQPINNVPGSVRGEGHEVLATDNLGGYWRVLIKKK